MKRIENGSKYHITESGQVFSEFTNRWLKPSYSKGTGYYVVNIVKGGKRSPAYIHRLVAEAFIPNPFKLPEVNHKDGNKLNNNVSNLEWVTTLDNLKHAKETGLLAHGKDHYKTELSEKEVREICNLLEKGWSATKISEQSGIPVQRNVVLNIRCGRDWKHISKDYSWILYPSKAKTSTTSRKA